jgi:hypothetical protein
MTAVLPAQTTKLITSAEKQTMSTPWWQYFFEKAVGGLEAGTYTVATLPPATTVGRIVYVSNEAGGAVLAFSDGVNWLRVTDRAIVS